MSSAIERQEEKAREVLRALGNESDWPRYETDWKYLDEKTRELRDALDTRAALKTADGRVI